MTVTRTISLSVTVAIRFPEDDKKEALFVKTIVFFLVNLLFFIRSVSAQFRTSTAMPWPRLGWACPTINSSTNFPLRPPPAPRAGTSNFSPSPPTMASRSTAGCRNPPILTVQKKYPVVFEVYGETGLIRHNKQFQVMPYPNRTHGIRRDRALPNTCTRSTSATCSKTVRRG